MTLCFVSGEGRDVVLELPVQRGFVTTGQDSGRDIAQQLALTRRSTGNTGHSVGKNDNQRTGLSVKLGTTLKYLRLIFEFEQRFSDLLGSQVDNVYRRRLLISERRGGRTLGVHPLQLLDGERDGGRGGGVLLAGRQLTGRHPGRGPAGQHQPRVHGWGRARVEDIIENTKVTQLHQVLGFQIDHWLAPVCAHYRLYFC